MTDYDPLDGLRPHRRGMEEGMTKPATERRTKEPFIPVLLAEKDGAGWKAWCPFCVRYHHHTASEGHRVAHCDDFSPSPFRDRGYILRRNVPRRESDALAGERMSAALRSRP
jgi:hypothetical protein